jgi:hypothetical protein
MPMDPEVVQEIIAEFTTVDICEPVTTDQPGWAGAVELQQTARARILAGCEEPDIA